jgi:hypothetical protein
MDTVITKGEVLQGITMNQQDRSKKISQLIAKCWADEDFKQTLLADPAAALKAAGVELPAGTTVKIVENTDKVFHLAIPAKPTDLSDDDLDQIAGGTISCSQCCCCSC